MDSKEEEIFIIGLFGLEEHPSNRIREQLAHLIASLELKPCLSGNQ
jgi:hypothetical protein